MLRFRCASVACRRRFDRRPHWMRGRLGRPDRRYSSQDRHARGPARREHRPSRGGGKAEFGRNSARTSTRSAVGQCARRAAPAN